MYSLSVIKRLNEEAAERARSDCEEPVLVTDPDHLFGIPHLGYACEELDEKYHRVATLFCDTSGFGAPGEPALTHGQLRAKIDELLVQYGNLLVAIEEAGQFQAYIAVWEA
jgi:hypothetical protein